MIFGYPLLAILYFFFLFFFFSLSIILLSFRTNGSIFKKYSLRTLE